MRDRRAAEVAADFLSAVWTGEPLGVAALIQAIDRLLAHSHEVEAQDGADDHAEPPRTTYAELYAEAAARFPALGTYPVADPLAPLEQ